VPFQDDIAAIRAAWPNLALGTSMGTTSITLPPMVKDGPRRETLFGRLVWGRMF
jgi:hypothetical protein